MRPVIVLIAALSVLGNSASANEVLTEGTVITAANIDLLQDSTFEGHRVGDLLIERASLMSFEARAR